MRNIMIFFMICVVLLSANTTKADQGDTELVSMDSTGTLADGHSTYPSVSADGRYVAFSSDARNLVTGDTNGFKDIFIHDTQIGGTTRVSVDSTGAQANDMSTYATISADGRYVAFSSDATNLVAGDTNGFEDIFIHDTLTGTTTRVSVDSTGAQADDISTYATISADGRYAAFSSDATNLVAGDTNGFKDIFIHDTLTGTTTRVSVDSAGAQADDQSDGHSISSDGRYVAFHSKATNLVAGDTNAFRDIFIHDTQTGTTTRVSVDSTGAQATNHCYYPSLSADGRYVAFSSDATNLVAGDTNGFQDIFIRDTQTGTTTRVSVDSAGTQANNISTDPSISSDGRYVAFTSNATNLAAGDTNAFRDIFIHDTQTGTTTRVSVDSAGVQADDHSWFSSISADGRYVAFYSGATNLVAGDTNGFQDIFLHQYLSDADSTGGGSGGCFASSILQPF